MDAKQHKPIFSDRVKITSEWNAGANVTKTFAKYGWVPPSVAAAKAQTPVQGAAQAGVAPGAAVEMADTPAKSAS